MRPQSRRSLDGLLAIGPHLLDAQLHALAAYAARTEHVLDVLWALLPGEDPTIDAPDTDFPIVVFDDEIARFTPEERGQWTSDDDPCGGAATDWHVAHTVPQLKRPTSHLPVYGCPGDGEIAADAVLCVGLDSLDRQLARVEAYAIRSRVRLRGVYVACDPDNLRVLLSDFSASNRALGTGPSLSVSPRGEIEVHE